MLEILFLAFLCRKMGEDLRAKGWKPLFMQFMVVIGWVGAEFLGAMAHSIFVAVSQGPEAVEEFSFGLYVTALVSAAVGVSCVFIVAKLLPDRLNTAPAGGVAFAKT
jgi:hypothetical protein